MIKLAKIGIASAVLAATSLTAATPAAAHDRTGIAVVAGIIGLGLGAAIASDQPHYRQSQYYYDQTPQPSYYPQQNSGYGYGNSYGNGYAYGAGYGNGYGSRESNWQQRRDQQVRQRQWERQRYEQRRQRDYDDDDGY